VKLITEEIEDVNFLLEENNGKKNMYIEGVFLQSELKNKNGRRYPKHIMEKEVRRYVKEHVMRKNAYGELGHPAGPTINPDRISHMTVSLVEDGNNYIGKALVFDTPVGSIARNIMEQGGQLAVSSRGIGSLKRSGDAMEVCEDFMLSTCADIVINPSAPDAWVNGIYESAEWIWEGGLLRQKALEEIKTDINANIRSRTLDEAVILKNWQKFINAL
jgi:hypothetical protein